MKQRKTEYTYLASAVRAARKYAVEDGREWYVVIAIWGWLVTPHGPEKASRYVMADSEGTDYHYDAHGHLSGYNIA